MLSLLFSETRFFQQVAENVGKYQTSNECRRYKVAHFSQRFSGFSVTTRTAVPTANISAAPGVIDWLPKCTPTTAFAPSFRAFSTRRFITKKRASLIISVYSLG